MIESIRGQGKGEWWPTTTGSATYYCAECGKPMGVAEYTIDDNGNLMPSVVCPWVLPEHASPTINCKCGFHNYVRFIGWSASK